MRKDIGSISISKTVNSQCSGALTVSVVITAYNRPDYLKSAIESALSQTTKPMEIIVVDDCSDVDLSPVVESYGDRLQYKRLEENGGCAKARNTGVELTSADLVAFLDDDDIWEPEKLRRQVEAFKSGVEAVLCGFCQLDDPSVRQVFSIEKVDECLLRQGNHFCGSSGFAARRSVLLEERWDETLPNGQDWDLYIRLARRVPLAYVALPLFRYRRGHDSMVHASALETPQQLEKRARVAEKHRAWLGETYYRRKVAGYLLRFIGQRKGRLPFILKSVRRAGFRATTYVLYRKLCRVERRPEI